MLKGGEHLWNHMADAPVLLLPCLTPRDLPAAEKLPPEVSHDDEAAYLDRIRGASIYPAIQNIILACRALGLGTTITTNHLRCEAEVRTLLDLPDAVQTFALMPIGWPEGRFAPVARKPLSGVVHAEAWGRAWPAEGPASPQGGAACERDA